MKEFCTLHLWIFRAPSLSLLVPHACQIWAAWNWQEGSTIWAAGGIYPRETLDIWLSLLWDLLLFRKRVPSVQLSSHWRYGVKLNDFLSGQNPKHYFSIAIFNHSHSSVWHSLHGELWAMLSFVRLIRLWSHLVHPDLVGQQACKNQCTH